MPTKDERLITAVVHIPKAAGKTLRWIAKQQFAGDPRYVIDVPKLEGDPAEFYRGLSRQQKEDVWLVNDATSAGVHEYFDRPVRYVTMLREPVRRVLSWDAYQVPERTEWDGFEIARKVRDNAQTRALAGIGDSVWNRREQVTEEALDQAKRNIEERFALVGTSELFDETIVLAKRLLGWRQILYQRRNVSPDRAPELGGPPPEVIEAIAADNVFDSQLYDFIAERLDKAIRSQGLEFKWEVEALRRLNATNDQPLDSDDSETPPQKSAFYAAKAPQVIRTFKKEHREAEHEAMVRAFRKYARELAADRADKFNTRLVTRLDSERSRDKTPTPS